MGLSHPMDTTKTLTEGLRVNVTPAQKAQLEEVAERQDRSVASVIRRAIKELIARELQEEAA